MMLQTVDRPVEMAQTSSPDDEYWATYERGAMPRELLALCAVGISIGTGIVVAVTAFL